MKPILCFYMGYSTPFNGIDYKKKNCFGSEINTILLAESLINYFDIYIFSNIQDSEEIVHNNVTYLNYNKIHLFKHIDIMIIVRYINYFIYFKNIAKKVYIWVCDMIVNPAYNGLLIEQTASSLIYNLRHHIDGLICLSDWHMSNIKKTIDTNEIPIHLIFNPINLSLYNNTIKKIKNRFIYFSDPSRGLDILLNCLLYIKKTVPDISLTLFRKNELNKNQIEKINQLKNVILFDKEPQECIANECLQAEYFFYPTSFYETFCNCAAEAQYYKCVCIYNNIGSLSTIINNRGLRINYDIKSENYIKDTCNKVIELMNNEEEKNRLKIEGHNWAKDNLHINNIKNKWLDFLL